MGFSHLRLSDFRLTCAYPGDKSTTIGLPLDDSSEFFGRKTMELAEIWSIQAVLPWEFYPLLRLLDKEPLEKRSDPVECESVFVFDITVTRSPIESLRGCKYSKYSKSVNHAWITADSAPFPPHLGFHMPCEQVYGIVCARVVYNWHTWNLGVQVPKFCPSTQNKMLAVRTVLYQGTNRKAAFSYSVEAFGLEYVAIDMVQFPPSPRATSVDIFCKTATKRDKLKTTYLVRHKVLYRAKSKYVPKVFRSSEIQ